MKNKKFLYLALLLSCLFLFFFRLGDRSFRNPDEGRYAEIAREMVVNNDWIQPTLYGVDYLRKPALFYWLVAASFKIFGMNEFAARLVPALFGLLGVLVTYFFVRKTIGEREALFSSAFLATNIWYLQVSRYLLIDSVFSFFLIAAAYSFYCAFHGTKSKKIYYALFYASLGLAFMTKGLAGVIIPAASILFYLVIIGKLKTALKEAHLVMGTGIFLLIVLPWYVAISIREPEFLHFFFIHEQFSRYTSSNFEHQQPFFYYFLALPLFLFPWIVFPSFFGKIFEKINRPTSPFFYAFIYTLVTVLFYSVSKSKLPTYILPAIPLLSVLFGQAWASENPSDKSLSARFSLTIITINLLLSFAVLMLPLVKPHLFAKLPVEARPAAGFMLLIFVLATSVSYVCVNRRKWSTLFIVLAIAMGCASTAMSLVLETYNSNHTTKYFAEKLKPLLKPHDRVFLFEQPGAFYDFAFYLPHPVQVVGLSGELELNRGDIDESENWTDYRTFDKLLASDKRIFCLMRKSDYQEYILGNPIFKANTVPVAFNEKKVLVATVAAKEALLVK